MIINRKFSHSHNFRERLIATSLKVVTATVGRAGAVGGAIKEL